MATYYFSSNEPKHAFINPYNFVGLYGRVDKTPAQDGEKTGVIHCKIYVKDKIAMPDHAFDGGNGYPFFHYRTAEQEKQYLIPGSSIRGCIRAVFDAVTPSCFSVVNNNLLSKRESEPTNQRKPGLLMRKDGSWVIYQANYTKQEPQDNQPYCKRIWIKQGSRQKKNDVEKNTMYFYFEGLPGGECTVQDALKKLKHVATCSDADIQKLLEVYDSYYEGLKGKESKDADTLRSVIRRAQYQLRAMKGQKDSEQMLPVFYQVSYNRLAYLSPAHTGRVAYSKTVQLLLGEYAPCTGKEQQYCPACRLFGTLGEKQPLASHLRFSDAKAQEEVFVGDTGWLPELSSPKISAAEFYTLHPERQKNGKMQDLASWSYGTTGVSLRGRKFYYHSKAQSLATDDQVPFGEKKRRVKTTTLSKGSVFRFDVYFDKIDELQLRQLLWALTFGENQEDGVLCHKLGLGRPVGYGSVKIVVTGVQERKVNQTEDGKLTYQVTSGQYEDYIKGESPIDENNDAVQDLLTIARYDFTDGKPVRYPYVEAGSYRSRNANDTAAHRWFSNNRKKNKFQYTLPLARSGEKTTAGDVCLPALAIEEGMVTQTTQSTGGGKVELQQNQTYTAVLTGEERISKGGYAYCNITIDGAKADNVKKSWLPKSLRSLPTSQLEGKKIRVTFTGKNQSGFYQYNNIREVAENE